MNSIFLIFIVLTCILITVAEGLMKNGCTLKKYPRNVSKAKALSTKKTWRDSLPIDMFLSAVSVLVVAQSISEIPDGLMNNPVCTETVINGSLSPQHGASSGCGWRNGLQYGG
jgi:hypothetical protein